MAIKKLNPFKKQSILELIQHYQFISVGYFVFICLYLSSKYIDSTILLITYRVITILYISILFILISKYVRKKSRFSEEMIEESHTTQKNYQEISDKIYKLILEEKPYLDPKITIYQLAKMVDTNEKYLSALFLLFISSMFGQDIQRQMISSQGNSIAVSNGMYVSQSIGQQSLTGTSQKNNLTISQGYQQSLWNNYIKKNNFHPPILM